MEELNYRFNDGTIKFIVLNSDLEPKNNFKSFKVDVICKVVDNFYPGDLNDDLEVLSIFYDDLH